MNINDLAAAAPPPPKPMSMDDLASPTPQAVQTAPARPMTLDDIAQAPNPGGLTGSAQDILNKVTTQPFGTPEAIKQSPVGKALDVLAIPEKALVGATVRGLDKLTPGIQAKLNPTNSYVPDLLYSDVINYYAPSGKDISQRLGTQQDTVPAKAVEDAYWGLKTGIGLAANFFGDPLFFLAPNIGGLTAESEAAYKAGENTNLERNAVTVNYPYTSKTMAAVPVKAVTEPIQATIARASAVADRVGESAAGAVSKVPGGTQAMDAVAAGAGKIADIAKTAYQTGKDLIDSFNPWTGNLDVDNKRALHSALQRGDKQYVEDFIKSEAAKNYTDSEKSVIRNVVESTPNVDPSASEDDRAAVSEGVKYQIPKVAESLKADVPSPRAEDIHDTVMRIKFENAADVKERQDSGLLSDENPSKGTIENYLVHKLSPEAEAYIKKNPNLAAASEEAQITKKVEQSLHGNTVSSYDSGRYQRKIRNTLDEANKIMQEKTGVKSWFIEDPVLATAMKRAETRKLIRDKQLLESISDTAVRPKSSTEARIYKARGYQDIPHPDFEGKTLVVKGDDGVQKVKIQDLLFPKNIAQKVSYDILPRGGGRIGNVNAFLDSYNRVFRNFALFKPDYYLENWIDNVLKNYIVGVKMEDYADAARVMGKMIEGKISSPAMVRGGLDNLDKNIAAGIGKVIGKDSVLINGKRMPIGDVVALAQKYNVNTGGHFAEGLEHVLYTGKRVAAENTLASKTGAALSNSSDLVKQVFRSMHFIGERGENFTRMALFLNRLKQGYTAERAVFEVEKFLFDFKRTTANMDVVRRFYNPFIQAAFKTAFVTPELIGRSASAINFYENTLMRTIQYAFNDPVTSWAVQKLYPNYYRMHDRIAGPLLPGNHWLAAMAGYGPNRGQMLPLAVALGLPGGLGILNQFMIYDSQVLKQNAGSSPILRSFAIAVTGKDPWTGVSVDIVKNTPDFAKRFNWAMTTFVKSALAMPNLEKMIYQRCGIVDTNYIEPESILAFHGAMGKFARVTDLSREYLGKMFFLASAEKELRKTLLSAASREMQGRTADESSLPAPARAVVNQFVRPMSSAEVYSRMVSSAVDMQKDQIAAGFLSGALKPEEVTGYIKNLQSTVKQLNANYQVLMNQYFEMTRGMRANQINALFDQMKARQDEADQQDQAQ